jgi:hypothetical protein
MERAYRRRQPAPEALESSKDEEAVASQPSSGPQLLIALSIVLAALLIGMFLLGNLWLTRRSLEERAVVLRTQIARAQEGNMTLEQRKAEMAADDGLEQALRGLNFQRDEDVTYVVISEEEAAPGRQAIRLEPRRPPLPNWMQWLNWFSGQRPDLTRH